MLYLRGLFLTWSFSHKSEYLLLLMADFTTCISRSSMRKFRSPNQNTTLWEKSFNEEVTYFCLHMFPSHTDNTAVYAPAVARNGVLCRLTRGQGPRRQPDPRTAAAAGCSQNPPCAVRSFPCEPAGDSWGSRWCDQTPTCGHSPHLYSPVTLTGSESK